MLSGLRLVLHRILIVHLLLPYLFFYDSANGFGYCLNNKPKINNLGTIRGRLGYIFNNVLWYATAGGAWSSVKSTFTSPSEPTTPGLFSGAMEQGLFLANSGSFSSTRSAWTVGGGYPFG